jgi:hypothetical protein
VKAVTLIVSTAKSPTIVVPIRLNDAFDIVIESRLLFNLHLMLI